jgi:hypothetical protein
MVENFSFFHECASSVKQHQLSDEGTLSEHHPLVFSNIDSTHSDAEANDSDSEIADIDLVNICEDDIRNAINRPFSTQELLYADIAVDISINCGALEKLSACSNEPIQPLPATHTQRQQMEKWQAALAARKVQLVNTPQEHLLQNHMEPIANLPHLPHKFAPSVTPLTGSSHDNHQQTGLNQLQSMAHNIVTSHLCTFERRYAPPMFNGHSQPQQDWKIYPC